MGSFNGTIEVVFVCAVLQPNKDHLVLTSEGGKGFPRTSDVENGINDAATRLCRELIGEPVINGEGWVNMFQQQIYESPDRISIPYLSIIPETVSVEKREWTPLSSLQQLDELDLAIISNTNWSIACGIG